MFQDVKVASKQLGFTINDMITACMGSAVKKYFEEKGDMKT